MTFDSLWKTSGAASPAPPSAPPQMCRAFAAGRLLRRHVTASRSAAAASINARYTHASVSVSALAHARSAACSDTATAPAQPAGLPHSAGQRDRQIYVSQSPTALSASLTAEAARIIRLEPAKRLIPECDTSCVTAAYVHLPFCKRKCFYCDFPVMAIGAAGAGAPGASDRFRDYVNLLLAEIGATGRSGPPGGLSTVFFGGGTPSLIPPPLLAEILAALEQRYGIAAGAEISMEADPGTFDVARLREYMALGVNRFSVGVQAFQQPLLEACGRSHSVGEVHAAIAAVGAAAPASWSLDLISGLPGLTRQLWQDSLRAAAAARPPHISVYDLQVEEGTPFATWYPTGSSALPPEDDGAAMYSDASRLLQEAGYEHYEVSNYALPGHRCRHNEVYWRNEPYYAFGLGAASHLQRRRFSRPRKMAAYRDWVAEFVAEGGLPGVRQEPQTLDDELLDTVMLSLRLADGLDMALLSERHGVTAAERIRRSLERHLAAGLVTATESRHVRRGGEMRMPYALRLADPGGFLVSNDIISDVFAGLSDGDAD